MQTRSSAQGRHRARPIINSSVEKWAVLIKIYPHPITVCLPKTIFPWMGTPALISPGSGKRPLSPLSLPIFPRRQFSNPTKLIQVEYKQPYLLNSCYPATFTERRTEFVAARVDLRGGGRCVPAASWLSTADPRRAVADGGAALPRRRATDDRQGGSEASSC